MRYFQPAQPEESPTAPKWLAYFGFAAAMVNFAFGVSFNFMNLFIGEWIIIAVFIAYIITLALTQNARFTKKSVIANQKI